jgi:hypothetical protein
VSGAPAEPDRAVIVLSEVLMPRKPCVVEVAATPAGPPALMVALAEAAVRTGGPVTVVAGMSAAAEAVAIASSAPTAQTAASAATRAVRKALNTMRSSWIRTYRAHWLGRPRVEARGCPRR